MKNLNSGWWKTKTRLLTGLTIACLMAVMLPIPQASARETITVVDSWGQEIVIPYPVERIVSVNMLVDELIVALGGEDKVVGVDLMPLYMPEFYPTLQDKASVGLHHFPSYEKVIDLNPQVVITSSILCFLPGFNEKLEAAGIKTVTIDGWMPEVYDRDVRTLGKILGKEDRAEELIKFTHSYLDLVAGRVKDIPPEERTKVYWEFHFPFMTMTKGSPHNTMIEMAGGKNVFAEAGGGLFQMPSSMKIPAGMKIFTRIKLPAGTKLPNGMVLEEGIEVKMEEVSPGVYKGKVKIGGEEVEIDMGEAGLPEISLPSGLGREDIEITIPTMLFRLVSPEAIVGANPEVMIGEYMPMGEMTGMIGKLMGGEIPIMPFGYTSEPDPDCLKSVVDDMTGRPAAKAIDAVVEGRVYAFPFGMLLSSARWPVGICYLAKMFYPDRFEDIDPEALHKEWIEKWYGLKYQGLFIYPEI